MKVVVVHGQNHKGSTYHIAHKIAEKISDDITEIFLPREFNDFCIGCSNCFLKSETKCPHYKKLEQLMSLIDESDVIILASPVYVFHVSGAMKNFLDHCGYRWMLHRPEVSMFKKQGVCISTAAGAGMKRTNNDMYDSLFHWGVAKIYKYGIRVAATNWNDVSDNKKQEIEKATSKISKKIIKNSNHVKPNIKTKLWFCILRNYLYKINNQADIDYWQEKGWTGKNRPWK